MHELSICLNIVDLIEKKALGQGLSRVSSVTLEIGDLVAIDEDALRYSFPIATRDTIAENAELLILNVIGQARCETCDQLTVLKQYGDACVSCGSYTLDVIAGREFILKEIKGG